VFQLPRRGVLMSSNTKESPVYIGLGTILVILLIIALIMFFRGRAV
jgi:hypothetical protein